MGNKQKRIARIVVEGAVQGVGYRVFVAREAGRLYLDGWVRNRRDGSVETLVAGPSAAVEEFLIAARRGPRTAAVVFHRIEEADESALRERGGGQVSSWRARLEAVLVFARAAIPGAPFEQSQLAVAAAIDYKVYRKYYMTRCDTRAAA